MKNISAFPRPASQAHQHGMHPSQEGMTLRDYFAAKAMQGWIQDKTASSLHSGGYMSGAIIAYQMADAMLKVRNENN